MKKRKRTKVLKFKENGEIREKLIKAGLEVVEECKEERRQNIARINQRNIFKTVVK